MGIHVHQLSSSASAGEGPSPTVPDESAGGALAAAESTDGALSAAPEPAPSAFTAGSWGQSTHAPASSIAVWGVPSLFGGIRILNSEVRT